MMRESGAHLARRLIKYLTGSKNEELDTVMSLVSSEPKTQSLWKARSACVGHGPPVGQAICFVLRFRSGFNLR